MIQVYYGKNLKIMDASNTLGRIKYIFENELDIFQKVMRYVLRVNCIMKLYNNHSERIYVKHDDEPFLKHKKICKVKQEYIHYTQPSIIHFLRIFLIYTTLFVMCNIKEYCSNKD